jgi:glycosyltransferase involved in cell wall biosynthesis
MQAERKKVLLLAVCRPEAIGGQAACARMLISHLKTVEWIAISFPLPGKQSTLMRFFSSVIIVFRSFFICFTGKASAVHILTACGKSALLEKLIIANILKLTGVKVLLNFQGALDHYYPGFSPRVQKRIVKLLRNVDKVLCLHDDMKAFLILNHILAPEKILVIPNAVPVDPALLRNYDANETPELLYLGWLIRNKGVPTLVEAVSILINEFQQKNFRLNITGPEMEKGLIDQLKAAARSYGTENFIQFNPPVFDDKKKQVFAHAAVFVFPSRMEGFPFVLLEAMQAGLPVVATDVSPMNKVVTLNQTGLLFEKDNARDLALKISILLKDPSLRRTYGERARRHIIETYSLERIIPHYEKLYAEIL